MSRIIPHAVASILILCLIVNPTLAAAVSQRELIVERCSVDWRVNTAIITEQAINVPAAWCLSDLLHFAARIKAVAGHVARLYLVKFNNRNRWISLASSMMREVNRVIDVGLNKIDHMVDVIPGLPWGLRILTGLTGFVAASVDLGSANQPRFAFNPLTALGDPQIRHVFTQFLRQRIDPLILANFYRIGVAPASYRVNGHDMSIDDLVGQIVNFLAEHKENDPWVTAQALWDQLNFGQKPPENSYVPKELQALEEPYLGIRERVLGLPFIQDQLPRNGVIADIGAGRNRLGEAILNWSDRSGYGIAKIIGVDVNDWAAPSVDSRLIYRRQVSKRIPIEDSSVDLVMFKWSLHHMTLEEQVWQLKEARRILKPQGRIIVIEALRGTDEALKKSFERDRLNSALWPDGPWQSLSLDATRHFLALDSNQQRQVLALEDYYGHLVDTGRTWMPFPFTYLTPDDLHKLFSEEDMIEVPAARRVFGLAPTIHNGPPTARYVFQLQLEPMKVGKSARHLEALMSAG